MTNLESSDPLSTRTWHVGDVKVTRVVELIIARSLDLVLPDARAHHWADLNWLRPQFMDANDRAIIAVHSFILEVAGRVIVVDTGYGNHKTRHVYKTGHSLSTDFLERMHEAGGTPARVDTVLTTHLHLDHVGWNTTLIDGEWVPTFPRARYLMDGIEINHWSQVTGAPGTVDGDHAEVYRDSIAPILAAGLVDRISGEHEVLPGIDIVPTPGHTPGHACIRIRSRGAEAWILGDVSHHPIQLVHPELGAGGDVDRERAQQTRELLWRSFADQRILVFGSHWAGDPVHIASVDDGLRTQLPH